MAKPQKSEKSYRGARSRVEPKVRAGGEDLAWVFGIHAVVGLLERFPGSVRRLLVQINRQEGRVADLIAVAQAQDIPLEFISRHDLDKQFIDQRHQGVAAECIALPEPSEADLEDALARNQSGLWLVLDEVQDPHNLGACLRTAAAAGCLGVVIPRNRSASLTGTVRKVASGAVELVPLYRVTNLARTLRLFQDAGVQVIGAAGSASKTLYQLELADSVAWVLGSEAEGLRRLTREHCNELVNIPMALGVESLNVSVAAGICLFEAVRKMSLTGRLKIESI